MTIKHKLVLSILVICFAVLSGGFLFQGFGGVGFFLLAAACLCAWFLYEAIPTQNGTTEEESAPEPQTDPESSTTEVSTGARVRYVLKKSRMRGLNPGELPTLWKESLQGSQPASRPAQPAPTLAPASPTPIRSDDALKAQAHAIAAGYTPTPDTDQVPAEEAPAQPVVAQAPASNRTWTVIKESLFQPSAPASRARHSAKNSQTP